MGVTLILGINPLLFFRDLTYSMANIKGKFSF